MKTLTTFLVALFTTINSFSQTLIRWDFEVGGSTTLQPTQIADTSLLVNPVAFSDLLPLQGMSVFVIGVSGQQSDVAINVRDWSINEDGGSWLSDWIEFRFFLETGIAKIDSISFWYKKNILGPRKLDFRSHKDGYSNPLETVAVQETDISWHKWVIPLDSFFITGLEQVTFRVYGTNAFSSNLGTLAIDSVAIFGQVSQLDSLSIKAVLSGPWNGTDMDDDLRVQGLVPLTDPYGFGKTTTVDVLAVTGSNAIVDWVLISLRSPLDSTQVVYEAPFLLQRDGDVVALDGISSPLLPGGDYYLSVSHRNHLGVMTATLVQDSVDFTNPATPVTGTESRVLVGDKALLWSGDASGNGVVKYTGSGNDRDPILVAIGGSVPTNTVSGYFNTDVNMDGVVKYTGSGNDRDYILLNVGGSVPTNTRISGIP